MDKPRLTQLIDVLRNKVIQKKKGGESKSGLASVKPQARVAPKRPAGSKPSYAGTQAAQKQAAQRYGGPAGKAPPTEAPPIAASTVPGAPPVRVRKKPQARPKVGPK